MKRPGLISSDCYDHIFVKRAGKILHIQQVRREIHRRLAPKPCLWVTDEIHPLVPLESAVHFAFRLSIKRCWRLDQTPSAALRVHDESVLIVIGISHRDIIAHGFAWILWNKHHISSRRIRGLFKNVQNIWNDPSLLHILIVKTKTPNTAATISHQAWQLHNSWSVWNWIFEVKYCGRLEVEFQPTWNSISSVFTC